ncbi:MAG: hypothetical protein RIT28_870 [Pseudomonadota bacterium]
MLRLLPALFLVSCAAEVPPRADAGDPRVLPVGAEAALDGSFSEGDALSYAWSVSPGEGAVLHDAESPFATLTAEAPGLYTLSLEVCDADGRCDVSGTWARVEERGSARRIDSLDTFAGAESGAGAPLGAFEATEAWCKTCLSMAGKTSTDWIEFCRSGLPEEADRQDWAICDANKFKTTSERKGYCFARGCER